MGKQSYRLVVDTLGNYRFKKRDNITYTKFASLVVRDIMSIIKQQNTDGITSEQVYNTTCTEIAHQYCSTNNIPSKVAQLLVDEYYPLLLSS